MTREVYLQKGANVRVKMRDGRRYLDIGRPISGPTAPDSRPLSELLRSPNRDDRRAAAQHPKPLSSAVLNRLSLDSDAAVLEALASRTQPLPRAVLQRLFHSDSMWVRAAVVSRRQPLPRSVLLEASLDSDSEVLIPLLNRDDSDIEEITLNALQHDDLYVRDVAAQKLRRGHLTLTPQVVEVSKDETSPVIRRNLALACAGRAGVNSGFSDPATEEWRRVGIATFTTNRRLLRQAVKDSNPEVRVAAVNNQVLVVTAPLLRQLRNDSDPRVIAAAGLRFVGALSGPV